RLRLDAIDGNSTTAALAPVRSRMLRLPAVRLPGGRVVPTELPGLARQLRAHDRDSVRRVTRAIDSLDHALSGVRAKPASPRGLRALDQVMRDPRFHPLRPPWAPIFDRLADLRSWIGDRIDDALGTSYSARGGFGFLLVVLIAAAGFVLARGALGRLVVDGTTEKAEEPVTGPTAS